MPAKTTTVQTFPAVPAIVMEAAPANPLKGLVITVFTLKIAVAAFLLATVSLAPPVSADIRYTVAAVH